MKAPRAIPAAKDTTHRILFFNVPPPAFGYLSNACRIKASRPEEKTGIVATFLMREASATRFPQSIGNSRFESPSSPRKPRHRRLDSAGRSLTLDLDAR